MVTQGWLQSRLLSELRPIVEGRSHIGEDVPRLPYAEAVGD
jgi:hypothetical protein